MAYLVLMDGPEKGRRFDLPAEGDVRIGRNDDNTVVVDGPAISGRHCSITIMGGAFAVRDLGSTNGTRLNDAPVAEASLFRGDVLTLGTTPLMIEGADVPAREGDPSLDGGIERPRVEIQPRTTRSRAPVPRPKDFGKRRDHNRRWKILIFLIGLAVLAALAMFIRINLSPAPEVGLPPVAAGEAASGVAPPGEGP